MRHERANLRSERADLRLEKPYERGGEEERTRGADYGSYSPAENG